MCSTVCSLREHERAGALHRCDVQSHQHELYLRTGHGSEKLAASKLAVSTKPGQQSTKGYAQGSDLSVDRCTSYELDGDARHNKVLSRFCRREGVISTSCV
jgi:hypothetical protein